MLSSDEVVELERELELECDLECEGGETLDLDSDRDLDLGGEWVLVVRSMPGACSIGVLGRLGSDSNEANADKSDKASEESPPDRLGLAVPVTLAWALVVGVVFEIRDKIKTQ